MEWSFQKTVCSNPGSWVRIVMRIGKYSLLLILTRKSLFEIFAKSEIHFWDSNFHEVFRETRKRFSIFVSIAISVFTKVDFWISAEFHGILCAKFRGENYSTRTNYRSGLHTCLFKRLIKIIFSLFRETHEARQTCNHIFAKSESRFASNSRENIEKRVSPSILPGTS